MPRVFIIWCGPPPSWWDACPIANSCMGKGVRCSRTSPCQWLVSEAKSLLKEWARKLSELLQ